MVGLTAGCGPEQQAHDPEPGAVAAELRTAPLAPRFLARLQRTRPGASARPNFGYLPPPVDLSHQTGVRLPRRPGLTPFGGSETRFDLRTSGRLPPIRNQNQHACCWAFPPYGSLETVLLPAERWDFSENNLRYLHGFDLGPIDGGNALMAVAYLAALTGPATEEQDPFPAAFTLPSTPPKKFSNKKHLTEVLYLPDRAGPLDNDNIKDAIKDQGPVMTCLDWDKDYYRLKGYSFYNPKTNDCNHNVDIIGWDDSYSAALFASPPPGNGAFIIRNSWGTNWGEAGYGYVSYYDKMIGTENFVFVGSTHPIVRGSTYQHDPLGWTSNTGYNGPTAWMANIFAARADEDLHSVSFYTSSPGSTYVVTVHDPVGLTPTSGHKKGSVSGTFAAAGYHTVALGSLKIRLSTGRRFSVVVKLTTPSYNSPIPIEQLVSDYSTGAGADPHESFVSPDGVNWTDLTSRLRHANVCLKAFTGVRDHSTSCGNHSFDGKAWTTTLKSAGTVCRPAIGVCDLAETCDGQSAVCPADRVQTRRLVCRASTAGCDAAERCTGSSPACPADRLSPSGTICRESTGECDPAQRCSGTSDRCPPYSFKPWGAPCNGGSGQCRAGVCEQRSGCSMAAGGSSPPESRGLLLLALLLFGLLLRRR